MERLTKAIEDFKDEQLKYGMFDCNLLILKAYEYERYTKLYGKYKTVIGGAKQANKLFGFKSIKDFLAQDENYAYIKPGFEASGDIIVFDETHDAYISLGNGLWFGVSDDKFQPVNKSIYDELEYKIYRRM